MKKILMFSLLMIAVLSSSAQKQDSIVFNNAMKIIIKNKFSAAENFKMAGQSLLDKGFFIGSKDEQFGQIISQPFKINFGYEIIYFLTKDNEIQIVGKYKNSTIIQVTSFTTTESDLKPVLYRKHNIWDKEKFGYLLQVANAIAHTSISFSE